MSARYSQIIKQVAVLKKLRTTYTLKHYNVSVLKKLKPFDVLQAMSDWHHWDRKGLHRALLNGENWRDSSNYVSIERDDINR